MKKSTFIGFLLIIVLLVIVGILFLAKGPAQKPEEKIEVVQEVQKESIIANFEVPGELQLLPYKANNVEGRINIINDVLELYYLNDLKKKGYFCIFNTC